MTHSYSVGTLWSCFNKFGDKEHRQPNLQIVLRKFKPANKQKNVILIFWGHVGPHAALVALHHWGRIWFVWYRVNPGSKGASTRPFPKMMPSSQHVSAGIAWIYGNYCCFDLPDKGRSRCMIMWVSSSSYSCRNQDAAGHQPCPRSQFILCALPLRWIPSKGNSSFLLASHLALHIEFSHFTFVCQAALLLE